jgi:hypothetical protein
MRHPQLHAALRSAGQHAARELAARVRDGDEVPFELLEHAHRGKPGGARPTLYSYRPLVGLYVERHADALARLPAVAEAEHTMVAAWGVEAYLEARGVSRPPADPHARAALAVRQFLERLFEDAPDFAPTQEHFDRAFAELDAVLTNDVTETVVAIPLVGVEPDMATVAITRGVALQRPDALRGEVPDAALSGPDGQPADAIATLRWSARPGSTATPTRAREASRRLVTALRLHVAGAVPSAGPLVWLRASGSGWRAMAIGGTFASRGVATITPEDIPDLRTFVDLVARRLPQQGEVAWALRRWTLALDRDRPEETLSDLLLAGRALLEPEGPRSGRLAGRLAALCATGDERTALARRLARLALQEQEVVAGSRRIDRDLPDRVDELAECLRAVLRDCVVGHLRGDLVEIAEGILDGVADEARPAPAGWPSEREAGTAHRRLHAPVWMPAAEEPYAPADEAPAFDDAVAYADAAELDDEDAFEDAPGFEDEDTFEEGPGSGEGASFADDDAFDEGPAFDVASPVSEAPAVADPQPSPDLDDHADRDADAVPAADANRDADASPAADAAPPMPPRIREPTFGMPPYVEPGDAHPADGPRPGDQWLLDGHTPATGRTPEGLDAPVPEYAPPTPFRSCGAGAPADDAPDDGRPARIRPLDPTGEIRAARLRPAPPRDLWLDVTWDEPQMGEQDDDDSTGPWPVSEAS